MKKFFLTMAMVLLAGCSGGQDAFLKSLDGFWAAQDTTGKMSFTIHNVNGKLYAYTHTGKNVVLTVMTPNGEFIRDSQRLPVKVEMHPQWEQGDYERHMLVESIGVKHGYTKDQIYSAIANVDFEGRYDDRTIFKYLSVLGVVPHQGVKPELKVKALNDLKAELNAQRSLLKAPTTTVDMVLQLDSGGKLNLGEGSGRDMVLVRERMLDKIDTDRMANFQKLLDTRAFEIDKTINLVISEIDASLAGK